MQTEYGFCVVSFDARLWLVTFAQFGVGILLSRSFCSCLQDEEVWMHLNAVGVEPQFYALRWLLLMLTQVTRVSRTVAAALRFPAQG